ncbi:hypothetical protein FH972_025404 [Carpinus fangiana]|uniref:Uncharacterized protein n=1 Tax=Carpinus fangiana TaxID=176857 RepID=A0A5N6L1Y2_9ROSI|nr:hypothetical protein FH972_025404 [Carpinus fangiana]
MENSETCRLFVEKSGIEALLKLLLQPSIALSFYGMSIALHSTTVFKGFTQNHSAPLARAFCSPLGNHQRRWASRPVDRRISRPHALRPPSRPDMRIPTKSNCRSPRPAAPPFAESPALPFTKNPKITAGPPYLQLCRLPVLTLPEPRSTTSKPTEPISALLTRDLQKCPYRISKRRSKSPGCHHRRWPAPPDRRAGTAVTTCGKKQQAATC